MMNIEHVISQEAISPDIYGILQAFEDLCDELCVLTDRENEMLMRDNEFSDLDMSLRKISLLQTFDDKSRLVLSHLGDGLSDQVGVHRYLIQKIETLQQKLKVNTNLQLHVITQMNNSLIDYSSGRHTCH